MICFDFVMVNWIIAVTYKKYFVIIFIYSFLPGNALLCKVFLSFYQILQIYKIRQLKAELNKLLLPASSKMERGYY